ncbi:MAG: DUF6064 family protein [Betaproteobacteria bacterium]
MELPFTHAAFLDVFGAYNHALWPAATVLWTVTAAMALQWARTRNGDGRALCALLAVHWAWSGAVYHWIFFRRINPAAAFFGGGFVLEAILFAWLAVTVRTRFRLDESPRGVLGLSLVIYSLAYPLAGLAFGLRYPRMPIFAVPCPTTLLTVGLLLTASGAPRTVNIVPIAWSAIGASAAFVLGVRADLALMAAGVLLTLDTLAPRALGARGGQPA